MRPLEFQPLELASLNDSSRRSGGRMLCADTNQSAIFTLTPHFLSASTKCVGSVRSGVTVEMMTKTVPSSVPEAKNK